EPRMWEVRMKRIALAVFGTTLCVALPALGQNAAPSDKDKAGPPSLRYRFSHTPDGVLRFDSETGQVALCRAQAGAWVCNSAPEETAAIQAELTSKHGERDRLKADLASVQAELAALKSRLETADAKAADAGK